MGSRTASWQIYAINLARATDRWQKLRAQFEQLNLPYERVEAVEGARLPAELPEFSELSYKLLHGRRRTPAEIGCYLSHIECARRLLASPHTHALILEDDVLLAPQTRAVVEAAIERASEWDILRLSTVNHGRKFPYAPLVEEYNLAIALTREKGAGGYVINRRAAEVFLRRLLPIRVAWDIAFDVEHLLGLRSVFVTPLPIDQNTGQESQIQNDIRRFRLPRWRYLTVFPTRVFFESTRFFARSARLLQLKWRCRHDWTAQPAAAGEEPTILKFSAPAAQQPAAQQEKRRAA